MQKHHRAAAKLHATALWLVQVASAHRAVRQTRYRWRTPWGLAVVPSSGDNCAAGPGYLTVPIDEHALCEQVGAVLLLTFSVSSGRMTWSIT